MKRVDIDNERNNRLPKSITVGYTMVPGGAWIGHSFRLPFPTEKDFNLRVQKLVDNTRKALNERKHSSFIRIGFSAMDFVVRPKVGIDSFFSKGKANQHQSSTKRLTSGKGDGDDDKGASAKCRRLDHFFSNQEILVTSPISTPADRPINNHENDTSSPSATKESKSSGDYCQGTDAADSYSLTDEEIARQLQESYNNEKAESRASDLYDKDLAIASQLQSEYDRESAVLAHIERFSPKGRHKTKANPTKTSSSNKRSKLDSFFLKK